jgi:hypothetical protein
MSYKLVSLQELLDIDIKTCIGYKNGPKNHRIPCSNPISRENIQNTNLIRDAIRSGADIFYVQKQIPILATLCLCKSRHQQQAPDIVQDWRNEAVKAVLRNDNVHTQVKASTSADQVFVEMDIMDFELDRHDQEMRHMAEQFRRDLVEDEETLFEMEIDDTF